MLAAIIQGSSQFPTRQPSLVISSITRRARVSVRGLSWQGSLGTVCLSLWLPLPHSLRAPGTKAVSHKQMVMGSRDVGSGAVPAVGACRLGSREGHKAPAGLRCCWQCPSAEHSLGHCTL